LAYPKERKLRQDEAILVYADIEQTEAYSGYFNQNTYAITPIYNNSKLRGQLLDE
jgi:hypothetical protein